MEMVLTYLMPKSLTKMLAIKCLPKQYHKSDKAALARMLTPLLCEHDLRNGYKQMSYSDYAGTAGARTRVRIAAEVLHERLGGKVLFLQTKELFEFLSNCTYDTSATVPTENLRCFQLSVPSGLKFDNGSKVVPGLAFPVDVECQHVLDELFFRKQSHYQDVDEVYDITKTTWAYHSIGQNCEILAYEFGTFDTMEEAKIEKHYENKPGFGETDMSVNTSDAPHVELVGKILTYIRAFPHSLSQGVPSGDCISSNGALKTYKDRAMTLHAVPEIRDPASAHLRRGHFATLRDERFKRDEHGNPRVIFRRACIVNGQEIDPYTVNDVTHQASNN